MKTRLQRTGMRWLARLLALGLGGMTAVGVAAAAPPQAIVEQLHAAERAYMAEDYADAIRSYREVLSAGWYSSSLYYNLGCACHKDGQPGWAVAYLEEARRLSPRDPDVRHNLKVVLAQARDRVPGGGGGAWLLERLAGLLDAVAPADVVRMLLLLLWIGCLGLAATWFMPPARRLWAHRALAVVGGLLLLALAALALKAYQIRSAPSGVIVVSEVGVQAGPREGETVQFALHAGTLLRVGRRAGDWREIWLSPQMRGWVPGAAVHELRAARWLP